MRPWEPLVLSSLLVLDVEHFKAVNDAGGHEGGDAVLRSIGAILRASTHGHDVSVGVATWPVHCEDCEDPVARGERPGLRGRRARVVLD